MGDLKSFLKKILYHTGVLPLVHRVLYRQKLTVVMFHRILDKTDKRYSQSDPHYTMDTEVFDEVLHFFTRHFSVVSLSDVISYSRGDIDSLPSCPLLITFDDGWKDNHDYAMPLLKDYQMPSVLFMVSSAFGRVEPFWQEKVIGLYRAGALSFDDFKALHAGIGAEPFKEKMISEPDVRRFVATLFHQQPSKGDGVIDLLYQKFPEKNRQFVTIEELKEMRSNGFEIGFHGQTHTPLPAVNFKSEIKDGWTELEKTLGSLNYKVMSFPHGQYSNEIGSLCAIEGFNFCFSSEAVNIDIRKPLPLILGRICIDQEIIMNDEGLYTPEKLLIWLMR